MKKFRYRLESVLRLRKVSEERAISDFARVSGEFNSYQLEIQDARDNRTRLLSSESQKMKAGSFDPYAYRSMSIYFQALQAKEKSLIKRMESLKPELESKRAAMTEARRAVRTLEIHRDLKKAEHGALVKREENLTLDEFNGKRRS